MKSAYERAMEKMDAASGPAKKLTNDQKAHIAEIDNKYDAKIAETKLGFDQRLASAPIPEQEAIQQEMSSELARLEEKREHEKEAVWGESA